ncbi:MAG: hypothetical protein IT299_03820 [Dehalococcoidia bacterium]|nr:hypothetical protein [Dehalococcoidia bacterium]
MAISSLYRGAIVVVGLILTGLVMEPRTTAAQVADDPLVAPITRLSSDGRTASDGRRTLTVSKAVLGAGGEVVTVSGTGFNEEKGLYVAFCVIPALNQLPTPCGGDIDLEGSSGAARWVSPATDTPSYGDGLATPYEAGGSFSFTLAVSPQINPTTDCRVVRCAVVSRNDHRRTSDRSQDVFVPITFAGADAPPVAAALATPPASEVVSAAGAPPDIPREVLAPAIPSTVSSTIAPAEAPAVAPAQLVAAAPAVRPEVPALLDADSRGATRGGAQLRVEGDIALDAGGADVRVRGTGYDTSRGVFVAICAVPPDGGKPGPCTAGTAASAWISSNPPEYARALARPYGDDGAFDVTLSVKPIIDAKTDCRVVACALGTRADTEGVRATEVELFVPVSFVEVPPAAVEPAPASASEPAASAPVADEAAAATETARGERLDIVPLALAGLVSTLVLLAYSAMLLRRRRTETVR